MHKNKGLIVIGVVLFLLVVAFYSSKFTKGVYQDPELISFVRSKLLVPKDEKIIVRTEEGNYAYGDAVLPDGPGFYWGAAKIDNIWSYAFGGNGIPSCKEVKVFPLGVLNGKFDSCLDDHGQILNRKI